ncbi:MAG TPA: MBL fold metallo-hydrolase [Candidatus Ozemobacteraceae bacterium]|nr:MBL fold metallo-hydrolase [Candidatus Ozemobacteraceae bacterium]
MELQSLSERTRLIPGPVNIGVIMLGGDRVALVDSGVDRRMAKRVLELLGAYRLCPTVILNTHAHADHCGGNALIQAETGCRILTSTLEAAAVTNPLIQAIALYGGAPLEELLNPLIVSEPSRAEAIHTDILEFDGLNIEVLQLGGHSIGQIGFKVDGVAFLGDTLFPLHTIQKHRLLFIYDPLEHLTTLEKLRTVSATTYVGGHFQPESRIDMLLAENMKHVKDAFALLKKLLTGPQPYDRLAKQFFGSFELKKNGWEHFLCRATLSGFLSALKRNGEADYRIMDNLLVWYGTGKPGKREL